MLPAFLLAAVTAVLWLEPSVAPESVSFDAAARGAAAPKPPFRFVREDRTGTSAKVLVRDAAGSSWQVKGGPEGRADAFLTRLVSAVGYYADSVWFLRSGRIEGVSGTLQRARGFVQPDGSFTYAAFELRSEQAKWIDDGSWTWTQNPFAGTKELRALKLLAMLVSNWDNKDARDERQGSNTGVLELDTQGEKRRVYFVTDWGQSLGSWGHLLWIGRSNWNCSSYREQSADFVRVEPGGRLRFGYRGQHTNDFNGDITRDDARWLLGRLRRITPEQLRAGLIASGASTAEADCFTSAILERIELLSRAAEAGGRELP